MEWRFQNQSFTEIYLASVLTRDRNMTQISANELLQLKVPYKAKQSIKRKENVYWTALQYQSLYMMDNFLTEVEGTWDNLRCAENNMDR